MQIPFRQYSRQLPPRVDGRAALYLSVEAFPRIYRAGTEPSAKGWTRARAEHQELQNQVARGTYAPISLIGDIVSDASSQARSIPDALPKRLRQSNPALRSKDLDIIHREISEARRVMASVRHRF